MTAPIVERDAPPDARPGCPSCNREVTDPFARRFRYPFARCAACATEREARLLARFTACGPCEEAGRAEGRDVVRCFACGPRARLSRRDLRAFDPTRYTMLDEVDAAWGLLSAGELVEVSDLEQRYLLSGAATPRAPDSGDWRPLPTGTEPGRVGSPLLALALKRATKPVVYQPVAPAVDSGAMWRLKPTRAAGDRPELVLGLTEPERGRTFGAELVRRHPTKGALRLGALKPVATAPGAPAFDHLLRHLTAEMGWAELRLCFPDLTLLAELEAYAEGPGRAVEPRLVPRSSLADLAAAAAAAVGWDRDHPPIPERPLDPLMAMVYPEEIAEAERSEHYPTSTPNLRDRDLPYFEPLQLWRALLGDLVAGEPRGRIAARVLVGILDALAALITRTELEQVLLVGPAFRERWMVDGLTARLRPRGIEVVHESEVL